MDYAAPFVLKCVARVTPRRISPYSEDPFAALDELKNHAGKKARRALMRNTPTIIEVKLLVACTALRAARSQQLQDLMSSCEAWEPVNTQQAWKASALTKKVLDI